MTARHTPTPGTQVATTLPGVRWFIASRRAQSKFIGMNSRECQSVHLHTHTTMTVATSPCPGPSNPPAAGKCSHLNNSWQQTHSKLLNTFPSWKKKLPVASLFACFYDQTIMGFFPRICHQKYNLIWEDMSARPPSRDMWHSTYISLPSWKTDSMTEQKRGRLRLRCLFP